MKTIHPNMPLARSLDKLCDSAFGLQPQPACVTQRPGDCKPTDAPFTQRGSDQSWLAAEASRLYSLYPSDEVHIDQGERAEGSASPPFSETSTLRIEHEGVEELSTLSGMGLVQRRDSWVRRSWGAIRKLSTSVIGVLPRSLPSMKWNKTGTFVELEKQTVRQWESQGGTLVRWDGRMNGETRMFEIAQGSIC